MLPHQYTPLHIGHTSRMRDLYDDLVKNKLGEYGEGAKGWTSDEAKGFIKVTSTPLRAYYLAHPDEQR